MRYYNTFLALIFSSSLYCQVPAFNLDTTKNVSLIPGDLMKLIAQNEFSIIYYESGYWKGNKREFIILGYNKQQWYFQFFNIQVDSNNSSQKLKAKKKREIKTPDIEKLIYEFDKERFWTFDTDSLKIRSEPINDSMRRSVDISDGTVITFEAISKDGKRMVRAGSPYEYLKYFPKVTVRQNFINCMELFLKLAYSYRG
jgi:hypothetical protein